MRTFVIASLAFVAVSLAVALALVFLIGSAPAWMIDP
jgi:hypothetical protein